MKIIKICVIIALMSGISLQAMVLQNNNIEIKLVDHTGTPDKVLFYNASSPVEAKKFINFGLRPIHVIVHNKTSEPIVISGQSVGEQQPDVKEIIEIFKVSETGGALATLVGCGYITGLCNIFERKNARRFYPLSIGCFAGSFGLAYMVWQSVCNNNVLITPMIKKYILSSRMVIPVGAKRETMVLVDTSVSTNRCFFDVFNLEGSVVATFDAIFDAGVKA